MMNSNITPAKNTLRTNTLKSKTNFGIDVEKLRIPEHDESNDIIYIFKHIINVHEMNSSDKLHPAISVNLKNQNFKSLKDFNIMIKNLLKSTADSLEGVVEENVTAEITVKMIGQSLLCNTEKTLSLAEFKTLTELIQKDGYRLTFDLFDENIYGSLAKQNSDVEIVGLCSDFKNEEIPQYQNYVEFQEPSGQDEIIILDYYTPVPTCIEDVRASLDNVNERDCCFAQQDEIQDFTIQEFNEEERKKD